MLKASVLIVVFNARDFIDNCIRSIAEAAIRTEVEVLLIDNGTDGTADHVASNYEHVICLPSEGNIGFAAANNRLAERASGDYLVLLNPDAVLSPGAIDLLTDAVRHHPEAVAFGGAILSPEGEADGGNDLRFPSLGGFLRAFLGGAGRRDGARRMSQHRAEVLSGCFFMVKSTIWREIGGMDEEFFLYSEEVDFFRRIKSQGYDVWKIPESAVIHDSGGGDAMSPRRLLYMTIGLAHYLRKHWHPLRLYLGLALIWISATMKWMVGVLMGRYAARYDVLRRRFGPIAFQPRVWWNGYRSPGADPRSERR